MKTVSCDRHGDQLRSAIICHHLFHSLHNKNFVGFSIPWEAIPKDEPYEAWCNECEKILDQEKGWNNTSEEFANFKLVCEKCYETVKEINSLTENLSS